MKRNGIWAVVVAIFAMFSANATANDNAVILVYHHVSSDTPKSTSVSVEVFEQHMQYLATHHKVLPLPEIIDALKNKRSLPDKAVAITFDDGFRNIYDNGHPILRKYDFPYTIFVNPALIGKASYQLSWQQIQLMQTQGVTFANHGNAHIHSLQKHSNESEADWLNRVTLNVTAAEQQLAEKVGYSLKYFAYPYGEYNLQYKQKLMKLGYTGFAQHSGAIASHSDFGALPRFPSAGIYSKLSSLKVKLNSLAMPVSQVKPADPEVDPLLRAEQFSMVIDTSDIAPSQINCFKNGSLIEHEVQQKGQQQQLSVLVTDLDKAGRHRVNCTTPSKRDRSRYYWHSQPFFVATPEGKWLD